MGGGGVCVYVFWGGAHSSPPPLSIPLISHVPPWHVQQTLRLALCAPNTNKREAAGYWQADILLPSLVGRTETRQGLGI